jgi:hypothetical protein
VKKGLVWRRQGGDGNGVVMNVEVDVMLVHYCKIRDHVVR